MTINTDTKALNQSPPLPLFYKDPMLLRFEEHGDVGLAPPTDFGFARETVAIPLCVGEFAAAMRHYPIVFAMDEQASPLALVGMRRNDNLFVGRDGSWRAGSYVPAYLRRYPFIVTETLDKAQQLLAIDRGSERYVPAVADRADAERLFDGAEGKPTATAQSAMAFCHAYHLDYAGTVAFGVAPTKDGLTDPAPQAHAGRSAAPEPVIGRIVSPCPAGHKRHANPGRSR
jgi:hypothetical protein